MDQRAKYETPPNGFRTFLILWITQSISAFGSNLTFFAITIWLSQTMFPRPEQKPQLAFALTAISLSFGLSVLLAPVAGAWADRHDRKRTMLVVDFANGVLSVILMVLIISSMLQLWMLLLIVPLFAVMGLFHGSAFDTSYAMIVPEKQLPRANGMMQTMWALSGILAPAVAAILISLPDLMRGTFIGALKDGTALAVGIDAVTFFAAAITLLFLHIPSPVRTDVGKNATEPRKSMLEDMKEGARYILQRKPLLWLLATFTVVNFAASPLEVMIPLLVKFNLAGDWQKQGFTFTSAIALIGTAASIGGVLGGVAMSTWGGLKKRRIYGVVIPIMIAGLFQIVYGLSPFLYLTAGTGLLLVALVPVMNSHSQTIWQTQVPRHLQGRVFSVRRLIAQFSAPLGVMLAGLSVSAFDPGIVLAALGLFTVAFALFQLFNPQLLRVEDKDYLDNLATTRDNAVEEASDGDLSLGVASPYPTLPVGSTEATSRVEAGT